MAENLADPERWLLCCWIRTENEQGASVRIDSDAITEQLARSPRHTIPQKLDFALNFMARRSSCGGDRVLVEPKDSPAAWAENWGELRYLLKTLAADGAIALDAAYLDREAGVVTAKGWSRLGEFAQKGLNSSQAFVAMAFCDELKPIFSDGIAPAIAATGYKPHRVDSEPHIERIDWKIIQDIQASRFVVADVTTHRNGVYFEAGYAIGIGRKVIWTVHEDDLEKAHFDTRQFLHIKWKDAGDLRTQLERVILGVIGRGPGAA